MIRFQIRNASKKAKGSPKIELASNFDFTEYKNRMTKSTLILKEQFSKMRSGTANTSILNTIQVNIDEKKISLPQLCQIHVKDSKNLMVTVPEEKLLAIVERAIRGSSLNLNPQKQDSIYLKVPIPPLSADFKNVMVKNCKEASEKAKNAIRNTRKDARDEIKNIRDADEKKRLEKFVENETSNFVKQIDGVLQEKLKEIQNA